MSLNMYLYREVYFGLYQDVGMKISLDDHFGDSHEIDFSKLSSIRFLEGDWWSFLPIDEWFDNNAREPYYEGHDEFPVSAGKLHELREVCRNIMDNHELAPTLLPCSNWKYDEIFFLEVERTYRILSNMSEDGDFYYCAS